MGVNSAGNSGVIRIDYNPSSGVTFRENKTSNVQVVGKGYSDEQEGLDRRVSVGGLNNKVRDRRRMQKGNTQSYNPLYCITCKERHSLCLKEMLVIVNGSLMILR